MPVTKMFIIFSVLVGAALNYHFFLRAPVKPLYHPVPESEFSGHGVVDRVIQLKFLEATATTTDAAPATIKVAVTLPFDFNQVLHFKWLLTENIKLISGDIAGDILNFKAGIPQDLEIQVAGFSQLENRHVGFQIMGIKDGRKLFTDGIVASLSENTFESVVQNVEKIKANKRQD